MSATSPIIDLIRTAAEKVSLVEFAKEAEVPYTTAHACKQRNWTHGQLETLDKLAAAAERILARQDAAVRRTDDELTEESQRDAAA